MKKLSKITDIVLYIVTGFTLIAAIASAVWNKPMFLSSVRSNSMYPLLKRSDMILIDNLSAKDTVNIGDIVVFKVEEGSLSSNGWIVHRIVDGDAAKGYITKGDANDETDQAMGGTGPIQRNWIVSKVITLGNNPIKIPLIGYLPIWMEKLQTSKYMMPVIAVVLAITIGFSEFISNRRRKKKNSSLDLQLIYIFGGLTLSIIMGAVMLATSETVVVPYEVSEDSQGVLMGSNVGIVIVGEEMRKPLSELTNKGFLPIISAITTKDKQITFSNPFYVLKSGTVLKTEMILNASTAGKYNSIIHIGMFYPFLPSKLIYFLSAKSYWLALTVVSLIPGLPFMLYPLIDRKLRRKTIKGIRRRIRRIRSYFPIFN
jgi:signal peptidase